MKSNIRKVLFTLVILFLFSCMFMAFRNEAINHVEFNDGKNGIGFYEENPNQIEQSGSWTLIGTTISIDNNWTAVEATYDWCIGAGTESEPYIIENVTIDAQESGSCIEIQNSDEYFIIQNCSLYRISYTYNAGIVLKNVTNGKIIDNYCCNNYYGIYLYMSDNNTVSGNIASNNDYGISLGYSDNNTVSDNIANNNTELGIYLGYSNNNTVSGNTASYSNRYGIFLTRSDNNTVSDNTANNNTELGIYLGYSDNNTVSGNTASYNNRYGIELYYSDINTVSGNIASNNDYGIYLYESNNNTVSGNQMNFCGIYLVGTIREMLSHDIDDTNLVNNKPVYYYINEVGLSSSNFTNAGQIILINCNNSIISGHNLSNGSVGTYLGYSNSNTVSGNTASCNNRYGIELYYSDNNTVSGNTASRNYYGMRLSESNNNIVLGNTASCNNIGMRLSESNNNTIFLNYFTNNGQNAYDLGPKNMWDNGSIGNYWDDYQGFDANNDGIGDTPYLISGMARSQDNFPIWNIQPSIPFGNYFLLFTIIAILSLTILEHQKKKCHLR